VRIHGEHGRDVEDLNGTLRRYQWMRRAYRPFVDHYVALSQDLAGYMTEKVGVPPTNLTQIYNGVDALRFTPTAPSVPVPGCPFSAPTHWIIGTVGRMQTVKDQLTLARAFVQALHRQPAMRDRLRLVMIGDGPLRSQAQAVVDDGGLGHLCWLPGERDDIADIMRGLQCFVLPSLAEGVSNTILEAMATALPVLATRVGGNAELVTPGRTGELVPAADPQAMATALLGLAADPDRARHMGRAGRAEVEKRFSMDAMVKAYSRLYDRLLESHRPRPLAPGRP
jgi:sugar transferase (PEP-CTERM/EpsH1 system associated)